VTTEELARKLDKLRADYLLLAREQEYQAMAQNLAEQRQVQQDLYLSLDRPQVDDAMEQAAWVDQLTNEERYTCLSDLANYVARFNVPGAAFSMQDLRDIILGLLDIVDQWGQNGQVAPHVREMYESMHPEAE